ncbi:UNVERIFIED_CONTAM: hypothetical protein RMT77_014103 [Armadillidium vulgare]
MKPDFGNDLTNTILRQSQLIQTRLAGRAVIKVVNRCNTAKENNNLNLSECQLCQVPDAVYHLMRNTPLTVCNLSGNLLSKIPSKFATKFPLITELNLSNNKMSKLPDELVDCIELRELDLSHNSFVGIPPVVFKLPKLRKVNLSHNFIMDADRSVLPKETSLEEIDVRENPLTDSTLNFIKTISTVTIHFSPPEEHEWDDL